jgi:hypothetical protein
VRVRWSTSEPTPRGYPRVGLVRERAESFLFLPYVLSCTRSYGVLTRVIRGRQRDLGPCNCQLRVRDARAGGERYIYISCTRAVGHTTATLRRRPKATAGRHRTTTVGLSDTTVARTADTYVQTVQP